MGSGNFEKTNAEVKCALEEDTSGHGKYNEYMLEERAQIGKFAAEHGPAKAVSISQSFCPGKFQKQRPEGSRLSIY